MALDLQDGDLVEWFVRGKARFTGLGYYELLNENGESVFSFYPDDEDDGKNIRMIKRAVRPLKVGDSIGGERVVELPVGTLLALAEDDDDERVFFRHARGWRDSNGTLWEARHFFGVAYKILYLPEQ